MDWEQKILINELTQGKELAEQLRKHLNPISSPERRQFLVEKILASYEKALSMLNWDASAVETKSPISTLESPLSCANSSPKSDVSDQDNYPKNVYKKRKTEPRWTERVRVCSLTGIEGPLDDGYNWRKYGQKDILGANFPRGYYRCTHRHSQGCLATKQVQRSDEDPTIFEITYRGRHTCFQSSPRSSAMASPSVFGDRSKSKQDVCEQQEEKPKPIKLSSFNFRDGLKCQELEPVENIFPSFSFPDANGNVENDIFLEPMMENNLLGSFNSPVFISPASSDFSVSPCHMNTFGTPESDSTPASVTNSPIGEWDISIDIGDFDTNFPLEKLELCV